MAQPNHSTINNFTAGFKTEFTGLNFPPNAATDTQNCIFTLIGDVIRREGLDFETNFTTDVVNRTGLAISSYKWNNVGGDGSTQLIVRQVGNTLYFFQSSAATILSPLSTQKLTSTVNLVAYQAPGNANNLAVTECTYTDGNGYLFVYHQDCDPIYCYFTPGTLSTARVVANKITIQVRDFAGIFPEPGNPAVNFRPGSLTAEHNYNLQNQGWTNTNLWNAGSPDSVANRNTVQGWEVVAGGTASIVVPAGNVSFQVAAGITGAGPGQSVTLTFGGQLHWTPDSGGSIYLSGYPNGGTTLSGTVSSYSGTTMVVNIAAGGTVFTVSGGNGTTGITSIDSATFQIALSTSANMIATFASTSTGLGIFPANSDVWFDFKDNTNKFNPIGTYQSVAVSNAPAPPGHFILPAFNQNRTIASGIANLTTVSTTTRPTNGCWFAGRIWYTGVSASQTATGDAGYYTWTENVYFSQIITDVTQFGNCFNENDPTDQNLFNELPSDGGVFSIQGAGPIFKLFPLKYGLLVFAANGIWFVAGSTGMGFEATDFTINKISSVRCSSGTSVVDVNGFPMFWNEEGIYFVTPSSQGGSSRSPDIALEVENLCLGTILTFYQNIPLISKKYAKGDFNPIDYEVQWLFRSTNESSVTDRYQRDRILIFNIVNKAFYYYTLPAGVPYVHDIRYVAGPGGSTSPSPTFKYLTSYANLGSYNFTWSEEKDFTHFKDWFSFDSIGVNFVSYFITGFVLTPRAHPYYGMWGQSYKKFALSYLYVFLRNSVHNSYKLQTMWNFSSSGNSGKWSTEQVFNDFTSTTNFGMIYRRHRSRGHGYAMQMKITSVDGKPFDIMGWSSSEIFNAGG